MRIGLWRTLVFIIALAVFAAANAPAAFFVPQRPEQLTYVAARGTVWSAELQGVAIGRYHIDVLKWRLSPLDLVQGKVIIPVELRNGEIEGALTLLGNWHGHRRIVSSELRVSGVKIGRFNVPGETRIHGLDVLFEDGGCVRAQGRVESDVAVGASRVLNWRGPMLAGSVSCDGEDALITLDGVNEQNEQLRVRIVLKPDGRASWRVAVHSGDPETLAALTSAGFTPGAADGLPSYSEDTRWLP